MAYGDFKIYLEEEHYVKSLYMLKHYILPKNKYDRYQRGLASMVYKFFDKKSGGAVSPARSETLPTRATQHKSAIKNKIISNQLSSDLARVIKASDCTLQLT